MKIGRLKIKLGKCLREWWEEEEEEEEITERKSLNKLRSRLDNCVKCGFQKNSVCESCTNY